MSTKTTESDFSNRPSKLFVPTGSMAALVAAYLLGVWAGLRNTYGEAGADWARFEFALIITAIPFLLPLILNGISIWFLNSQKQKETGIILMLISLVTAMLVGLIIVPMGNF